MEKTLTQERLKEVLDYEPESGVFQWRDSRCGAVKVGDIAGYVDGLGYRSIEIDCQAYKAHRLAWLYVHGYFPENDIDHRDRNPGKNNIANLREVSRQCNARNSGNPVTNTSGVKGVCWRKRRQRWIATVCVNRVKRFLGYYADFDDAVCARLAAEQTLNWSGCDSNSPAFQYVKKYINGSINQPRKGEQHGGITSHKR